MAEDPTSEGRGAHWEQRSAARVVDASRNRLLARSRQFVEKATEVVARHGVDGLTVRTILEETGLSRRAFYERFASKDDLLVAVFEETMRAAAERFRDDFERQGISGPLDRLHHVVWSMISGASLDRSEAVRGLSSAMSREHLRLAESRPAELRHAIGPTLAVMAEQIEAGIEAGLIRPGEPEELAVLVHNLVASTIHSALLGSPDAYDGERTSEVVWDFCRRALVA